MLSIITELHCWEKSENVKEKKKESLAVSPDIAYGGKFLSVYYILISKWLN